jgi:hypothetical protein
LAVTAERGYLIPAWGKCYQACAERLRDSILEWHPDANITIMTDLPQGDQGGYANDWQVFRASPYRQTIKLEADMWCAGAIDHWWTLFENRDVVVSLGARNYYDQVTTVRHYRQVFDANDLPDVYNAITYWRLSPRAQEFFNLVKEIFSNWHDYRRLLRFSEDQPSTDVVYAMVAVILGVDQVTLPPGLGPTIVHMKSHIAGTQHPDWTQELIWEFTNPGLRINTVAQWGLVHYHQKDWLCQ